MMGLFENYSTQFSRKRKPSDANKYQSGSNSLYNIFFNSKRQRIDSEIFNKNHSQRNIFSKGSTTNQILYKEERAIYLDLLKKYSVEGFSIKSDAQNTPIFSHQPNFKDLSNHFTQINHKSGYCTSTPVVRKNLPIPKSSCLSYYKNHHCQNRNVSESFKMGLLFSSNSAAAGGVASTMSCKKSSDQVGVAPKETSMNSTMSNVVDDDCILVSVQNPTSCQPISQFQQRLKNTPYYNSSFIQTLKEDCKRKYEEKSRLVDAVESRLKAHQEERLKWENEMVDKIQELSFRRSRMRPLQPYIFEPPIEIESDEEEQEAEVDEFPELGAEAEEKITVALRRDRSLDEVLSEGFRLSVTRREMLTLGPSQWLSDMVINFYMQLIMKRSSDEHQSSTSGGSSCTNALPKVYAMTTFFYPKLSSNTGYEGVRRWTRKDNIFDYDLILFPIHLGVHWCLACADLNSKSIRYYDSMGGVNSRCLKILLDYLCKESSTKRKIELMGSEWHLESTQETVPQQNNGSDCGMFACKFAEWLARGRSQFAFSQEHMSYYRRRMVLEILNQRLLN